MKNLIYIITSLILFNPIHSQIWEQVSTPFDYEKVNYLSSMNGEVYISKNDWVDSTVYNYQYSNNEWIRAVDDTIYKEFGYLYQVDQFENKILVSCVYGVFLSDDYGKNWSKILEEGPFRQDCDISPNGIFGIKVSFESHLFKYDEVKKEWKQIQENKYDSLEYFFVKQIESNDTHLFALQQKVANPTKFKDTVSGGLFVSTDKGESWEKTLNDSTLLSVFTTDEYILVSARNGKLFKSEDNGKTWTENNIDTDIKNFSLDGDRIIATSNPAGIIESRDNGKTWQVLNKGIYNSQIYKKDDRYFLFHYNLVYESDSLFTEIKPTNLKNNSLITKFYNYNDTLLSVGSFSRGIQYSVDFGKTWDTYYPFLEDELVVIYSFHSKENQIYLRAPNEIYASVDYGKTFEKIPLFGDYLDLLILEDKILLYGNYGHVVSKDFGKTFISIDTTVLKNHYKVFKMVKTENSELLAFSQFNGVFKSDDNAETWVQIVDSLPTGVSYSGVYNFFEFDGIYYAFNSYPASLFKSIDKGKSWSKIEIELFDEIEYYYVYMIDENNIIVSSYGKGIRGLRITYDQGKTWKRIDDELPQTDENNNNISYVYRIYGNTKGKVFVGSSTYTYYTGQLFATTLDKLGVQTSVESEIQRNYLYTYPPYPLPAKSEVKVLFYWDINLPMSVDDISIYDLSGRKIQTNGNLRLEKQASHNGNLIWDCSSAESGVYIINIKHGTEEKGVKVVVE